jgi:pSer/pThr/pTyr-binding forkhead associated (FHA) protein
MEGFRPAELAIEVDGARKVLLLEAECYRLGRAASNQLSYPGIAGLSREHLAIERRGDCWVARDLGSTHGSLVNGEHISEPRVLYPGDRITAARVTLVYSEPGAPKANEVVFSDEPTDSGTITISESL